MRKTTATLATLTCGGLAVVGVMALNPSSAGAATTTAAIAEVTSEASPAAPTLGHRFFSRLTDEQKKCMDEAGVTRPLGPLSDDERAKVQADLREAATGCGITLPTGERRARLQAWWASLPAEQQTCLKDANLTRPVGPLSPEERQQLRSDVVAAAKKCNVTLPTRS